MTANEKAQAVAKVMWDADEASRALGMDLVEVRAGYAVLRMPVRPDMTNGHGTCHGGYIFTLADSAFAFCCNSHNQRAVAQHCNITFIAPVQEGDLLEAIAREVSRTGRNGLTDVRVLNQHGTVVAEFRGASRTIKGEHIPDLD